MDNNLSKIKIDERLSHLNECEIDNLMNRYYNNEKAKDLIEEYEIKISPSALYTIFPPIICDDKVCPYCGKPMFIKRPSKSSYNYNPNSAYCINCGHEDNSFCNCSYCRERKRIEKIKEEEEQKEINEIKRKLIYDTYSLDKYEPVKLDNLTFRDKVFLGALLRVALTEDMKVISPLETVERNLSPTLRYTKEILRILHHNNIICVSPNSSIEAFLDSSEEGEFPQVYYINKVKYVLNIEFKGNYTDEISKLMNHNEMNEKDKEEALKIWKEIALEECLEYLEYQMYKVKFDFSIGEKTIAIFKDLLENFSVSQIYGIIYKRVANATRYYQEEDISKKQAANSVIGNCQKFGERALLERWDLTKYHRDYYIPQSVISEFFFNRVTKIGDLGFEMPPVVL